MDSFLDIAFWSVVGAVKSSCSLIKDAVTTAKPDLLVQAFSHADPMVVNVSLVLLLALLCWVVSIITSNYSQVDRLWSFLPAIFATVFAKDDLLALYSLIITRKRGTSPLSERLLLQLLLVWCWSLRLSNNFYRRGGFNLSYEDYRWERVQAMFGRVGFQFLNITFVAFYQIVLLMELVLPCYVSWLYRNETPLTNLDIIASILFLSAILLESIADHQQWNFQEKKYSMIRNKETRAGDYKRGFLTSGLFRFSRHPNFFGEQMVWWFFYIFSVSACRSWINFTILAPIQLTMLFHNSTWLTEKITIEKYPDYVQYQKTTSRLLPWLPGKRLDEKS